MARGTRVGAYCLCRDDGGRILLCRIAPGESAAGKWMLPGGGVEFGEDPALAAVRELREESGLEGAVESVAGVHSRVLNRPGSELHLVSIVYRVRVTGGTLRDEVGGSTETCAWMSIEDAHGLELVPLAQFGLALLESEAEPAPRRRSGGTSARLPS